MIILKNLSLALALPGVKQARAIYTPWLSETVLNRV